MERKHMVWCVVWGLSGLLVFSGCGGDDGSPSGPGIPEGEEIFVSDPEVEDIMSVEFMYEDGSFHTRDVPVNQLLIMFDPDITAAQAATTLASMETDLSIYNLDVVGQLPRVGIYQLEIINDAASPAMAIATLNIVMAVLGAYDGVADVSYNELLEERFVENDDDNTDMPGFDRAAYGMIDYFQAIPAFDEVLAATSLSPVKVAIIDSGIDLDTDQFDNIQAHEGGFDYLDLAAPDFGPVDLHPQKHGTAIAGIIAADNGDGISNGIALRVLGDKLSLFVANTHVAGNAYNQARTIAATRSSAGRGSSTSARDATTTAARRAGSRGYRISSCESSRRPAPKTCSSSAPLRTTV